MLIVLTFCCFSFAALGSPISVMECSPAQSPYLLVVLASGDCKIWNIATRKLTLSDTIEPITHVRWLHCLDLFYGPRRVCKL